MQAVLIFFLGGGGGGSARRSLRPPLTLHTPAFPVPCALATPGRTPARTPACLQVGPRSGGPVLYGSTGSTGPHPQVRTQRSWAGVGAGVGAAVVAAGGAAWAGTLPMCVRCQGATPEQRLRGALASRRKVSSERRTMVPLAMLSTRPQVRAGRGRRRLQVPQAAFPRHAGGRPGLCAEGGGCCGSSVRCVYVGTPFLPRFYLLPLSNNPSPVQTTCDDAVLFLAADVDMHGQSPVYVSVRPSPLGFSLTTCCCSLGLPAFPPARPPTTSYCVTWASSSATTGPLWSSTKGTA